MPQDVQRNNSLSISNLPSKDENPDYFVPATSRINEITKLSPNEEDSFQNWIRQNKISDLDHADSYYDYRGFWKEFGNKSINFGVDHFPDTYKQHGHPTFSIESKYSKDSNDGGKWDGNNFIPAPKSENPDYFVPAKTETKSPESSSNLLDTVSKRIFEAPEFITKGAKKASDWLTTPELGDQSNPIMPYLKGAFGGMTEGAASLLSPANIATTLMPEGKILSLANMGIGAFQGIHGLDKIRQGNFAEGIGDIGFGTLGMFGGKKGSKESSKLPSYAESVGEPNLSDVPREFTLPENEVHPDKLKFKSTEQQQYDIARNKQGMGLDKPIIKDYWITDSFGKKILNPKYQPVNPGNPKAIFKGWQEDGEGGHYALYDIMGGPLDRSTVSEKSLKAAGIAIPETPKFSKENVGRDNAIANQKSKGIPPDRRAKMFRGKHEPVDIIFPDSNSRDLFGAGQRLFSKGQVKPGLIERFNQAVERTAKEFGLSEQEARKYIRQYNEEVRKLGSAVDKNGGKLNAPSFEDFIKGLKTKIEKPTLSSKLQEFEDSAKDRINQRGTLSGKRILSGLPIDDLTDFAIIGAAKLAKGTIKFADWSAEMINDFGENIKPYLKDIFIAAKAKHEESTKLGSNKQAPIKPSTRNLRQPSDEVIDKLISAITEAGPKRIQQENLYSVERAKRIQSAEKVSTKGLPGFYEQLHELKGELPKVDFERTKMKQSEVNDLINYVTNSPYLLPYEKIRAKMGLLKMLSSKREEVPQASELKLLGEVFGKKFDDVINLHGGLGGAVSAKVANEMANVSKSIMASIDMSAPLRQGLPLIHKKEWWSAIKPMIESFGSQDRFDALQESIRDRSGYLLGKSSGLKLTDLGQNKEEAYASKLADLIPGVKMSERAYIGFLNKLRADTFDSLVNDAKLLGHKPEEIGPAIAKYVNYATGRGDLGRLDPIAKELNIMFFSPRLISSRLTMLNPNTYVSKEIPAFVRKESLKSLLAVASFSITMNSLAHVMGASVSLDPTNSDFMKAKFGNTRMDPNGGVQQYIVAATRLLTGETTSSTSGKTTEIGKKYGSPSRVSMMIGVGDKYNRSFMENKFSPLVGLADDILAKRAPDTNGLGGVMFNPNPNDKNPSLLKGSYSSDVINRFVPLMVNDMIDLYKDDPNLFIHGKALLGAGAALGMGMQTYKPTIKKSNQMRISVR